MILYDKEGNSYISKDARLLKDVDARKHFKGLFYEKLPLYKKYYVEAIGDKWLHWWNYDVVKVHNGLVNIERYENSEGRNTEDFLYFTTDDLSGSDEDFISMLNERAFNVLKKMGKKRKRRLRYEILNAEKEIADINKLIKKTGAVAYRKKSC